MNKHLILNFITLAVFSVVCTSCFTTMAILASDENDISRERTYLSVKIFQTLSECEALAYTPNHDVVKIETVSDVYYDGKRIKGSFTLVDTYTYKTEHYSYKTVALYVLTSEYLRHKDVWRKR